MTDARATGRVVAGVLPATGSVSPKDLEVANAGLAALGRPPLLDADAAGEAPEVLAYKKAELEDFLKNKDDKKASLDDRFAALIEYYNSFTAKDKK